MEQNTTDLRLDQITAGMYVRYNQNNEIRFIDDEQNGTLELTEWGAFDSETVDRSSLWGNVKNGDVDIIHQDHPDYEEVKEQARQQADF